MLRWIFKPTLCLLLLITVSVNAKVHVGLTHWDGYTNPDGTGVYLELIYEIYGKDNVELSFTTYQRMTALFAEDKYDLIIGTSKEDVPSGHYPKWHLDYDHPLRAYYLKSNKPIKHLSDLNGRTLTWLNGYDFDRYIDYPHEKYPTNTHNAALKLLVNKRVDAFIDFEFNIPEKIKKSVDSIEILPARPIYLAFQNNDRGHLLAKKFDTIMAKLLADGRLSAIFGVDYPHANFDNFSLNRPKITITSDDGSMLRVSGNTPLNTLESRLYRLLLPHLNQFNIEFVKVPLSKQPKLSTSSNCFANKLKTEQRLTTFAFSKPFALYTQARMYFLSENLLLNNRDIPQQIKRKSLRVGIPSNMQFAPEIMELLNVIPEQNKVIADANVFSRMSQLNQKHNFDIVIEYPADIAAYWPKASNKTIYSIPLPTAKPYEVGHLMCYKTAENEAFIKQFDQVLEKVYSSEVFFNQLQQAAPELPTSVLEQYVKDVFLSQ